MPGQPGMRNWIAQRPVCQPNRTGKKKKERSVGEGMAGGGEINEMILMIFCYIYRSVPCPVVIREASSTPDERLQRIQRPTARPYTDRVQMGGLQHVSSHRAKGILWKRERLWESEGMEEHGPQTQLSRIHMGSGRMKRQALKNLHGSAPGPLLICYVCQLDNFVDS